MTRRELRSRTQGFLTFTDSGDSKLMSYQEITKSEKWNKFNDKKKILAILSIIDVVSSTSIIADLSSIIQLVILKSSLLGISAIELQKEIATVIELCMSKIESVDDKLLMLYNSRKNLLHAIIFSEKPGENDLPIIKYIDIELEFWEHRKKLSPSVRVNKFANKIKWKASPSIFGFVFLELIRNDYIEIPVYVGEPSFKRSAEFLWDFFEINTTLSNLAKELNPNKNTLSNVKRCKFPSFSDLNNRR